MAKPTAQQCHALTTYFIGAYDGVKGVQPTVNRNKARWGFESILMDHPAPAVKEYIDFYVKHYINPTLEWFLFNYDKVIKEMAEREYEAKQSARRRQETKERLERWRNR